MGLPSCVAGTPISSKAKNKLKSLVAKKVSGSVASKLIPGINWLSWIVCGLSIINAATGKNGIKITLALVYKKTTLRKEGYTIEGWNVKSVKVARY